MIEHVLMMGCCLAVAADASVSAAPSDYRLRSVMAAKLTIKGRGDRWYDTVKKGKVVLNGDGSRE